MPSYFYHIIFDIYSFPYPDPTSLSSTGKQIQELFKAFRSPSSSAKINSTPESADESLKSQQQGVLPLEESHLHRGGNRERRPLARAASKSGASEPTSLSVSHDWRYDRTFVQSIDMANVEAVTKPEGRGDGGGPITRGIAVGSGGLATKGKFEPSNAEEEDLGWGVIRLYRDGEETSGLDDDALVKGPKSGRTRTHQPNGHEAPFSNEDCTTLCILAVPSYLTPSDFLGFVGEKTRDEVSHFRMIRTERSNRYMVLMKFRSGRKAREWRKEWNGRAFDSIEVYYSYPEAPVQDQRT